MINYLIMHVLTALLSFPDSKISNLEIHRVSQIHIESSWKDLTSKAEITLPRNVQLFQENSIREIFKYGDRVKIEFGYDNNMEVEFTGYITQVSADIPVRIKCEDEMFKLKKIPVNYSNPKTTLKKLLEDICPGYEIDALEGVSLGSIRLKQTTASIVLEKLQSEFGLYSYFIGKKLVCGKYYADNTSDKIVPFNMEIIPSNSLEYRNADELLVKVKGTSLKTNGEKIQFEYGEDGGDVLTLTYFQIENKSELEKLVKHDYELRKVDGFSGSFSSFGIPTVNHGQKAELNSWRFPDKDGVYYVDSLVKDYGTGGIRRAISLGKRAV